MILASFMKAFLMCTLMMAGAALSAAGEGDAFQAKCSTAKGRMRKALGHDDPHVRKRRTIEVPVGTAWEMKWALNLPFETQKRYTAKLQITIPVNIRLPAFLYDKRGLEKLFGFYNGTQGVKAKPRMDKVSYDPAFDETVLGSLLEDSSRNEVEQRRPILMPDPVYLEQDPAEMAYHQRRARSAAHSSAIPMPDPVYLEQDPAGMAYHSAAHSSAIPMPDPVYLEQDPAGMAYHSAAHSSAIPMPDPVYLERDPAEMAYHQRRARSAAYSSAIQSERMELYYRVEGLFKKLGVPGPTCLQRTICELAQEPFEEGVLGDFVNLFLTPSMTILPQAIEDYGMLEDYVKAERYGEGGGHCGTRYEDCPASMFELLPVVTNSLFGQS